MNPASFRKAVSPITDKIKNALSRAVVRFVENSYKTQRVQLEVFKGEIKDGVEHFEPYGFTSFPLVGAEAILAAIGASRGHGVALLVHDPRYRPRAGTAGDAAMFHYMDDPEAMPEDATARLTATVVGGKRTLVGRFDRIDLKCGRSRLLMEDGFVQLETPDFEAVKT